MTGVIHTVRIPNTVGVLNVDPADRWSAERVANIVTLPRLTVYTYSCAHWESLGV